MSNRDHEINQGRSGVAGYAFSPATPRRSIRAVLLLLLCLTFAGELIAPAAAAQPCCAIAAVDARTGLVKARENATGRTFEFTVSDMRLRAQLRAGRAVDADFRAQQAWVPPAKQRYRIARLSAPPSTAGGKTLGPLPKGSQSPPQSSPGPAGGTGGAAQTQIAPGVIVALEAVMTEIILVGNYPGVTGGLEDSGAVLLTGPARPVQYDQGRRGIREGPPMVLLASGNPSVLRVPPGVQVPIGERVGKFTFLTYPVAQPTEVTITATFNNVSKTTTVKVVPPRLLRIEMPPSVRGGIDAQGRVVLNGPPTNAAVGTVKLASANAQLVKVPSSVTVPAGQTQAVFDVQTFGVSKDTPVAVAATHGTQNPLAASVKLLPPVIAEVDAGQPSSSWCVGPCSSGLRVVLDGKAPAEGLPIALTAEQPLSIPPTFTVPPGSKEASVPFTAAQVASNKSAKLSASYGDSKKRVEFKVFRLEKHDLYVRRSATLVDRFGNVVSQPPDSQPFKMCVNVATKLIPFHTSGWPSPTALGVSYRMGNTGRSFQVPVAWVTGSVRGDSDSDVLFVPTCFDLPGIPDGGALEVETIADVRKELDERNEGNNDRGFKVERN